MVHCSGRTSALIEEVQDSPDLRTVRVSILSAVAGELLEEIII